MTQSRITFSSIIESAQDRVQKELKSVHEFFKNALSDQPGMLIYDTIWERVAFLQKDIMTATIDVSKIKSIKDISEAMNSLERDLKVKFQDDAQREIQTDTNDDLEDAANLDRLSLFELIMKMYAALLTQLFILHKILPDHLLEKKEQAYSKPLPSSHITDDFISFKETFARDFVNSPELDALVTRETLTLQLKSRVDQSVEQLRKRIDGEIPQFRRALASLQMRENHIFADDFDVLEYYLAAKGLLSRIEYAVTVYDNVMPQWAYTLIDKIAKMADAEINKQIADGLEQANVLKEYEKFSKSVTAAIRLLEKDLNQLTKSIKLKTLAPSETLKWLDKMVKHFVSAREKYKEALGAVKQKFFPAMSSDDAAEEAAFSLLAVDAEGQMVPALEESYAAEQGQLIGTSIGKNIETSKANLKRLKAVDAAAKNRLTEVQNTYRHTLAQIENEAYESAVTTTLAKHKTELLEIEGEVRQFVSRLEKNPVKIAPPTFLARHREMIIGITVAFATSGMLLGGLLGALSTLSLFMIITMATGCLIGAGLGFVIGLLAGVVVDKCSGHVYNQQHSEAKRQDLETMQQHSETSRLLPGGPSRAIYQTLSPSSSEVPPAKQQAGRSQVQGASVPVKNTKNKRRIVPDDDGRSLELMDLGFTAAAQRAGGNPVIRSHTQQAATDSKTTLPDKMLQPRRIASSVN